MNYKKNINYFTKTDLPKHLGIAMLIIGGLLLIWGWGFVSYILMAAFLPGGLALFLVGSSLRTSEKELDDMIRRASADVEENLEENHKLQRRVAKRPAPIVVDGYEIRKGLMLAKSQSGALRSSEYTKAHLIPLSDALHISARTLSLIADQAQDLQIEIPYGQIKQVSLVREEKKLTFQKRIFCAKICRFRVERIEGKPLSFPIRDDILSEQFTEDLQKLVAAFQKSNETDPV